jgi:hypothetical protein
LILSTALNRSSNPAPLLLWCVIGLCVGIYLFIKGFRLLQRRHLILDTPVSKIRSASMGMVELSGLAVGPYTVVAPITERPCYYHRTLVWELKQQGKNKQWVKVAAECMHVPFFLDDNTAKVMIDPRGAELDLHRDFQQEFCDSFFTLKEEAPPNVRALLLRHGISTKNKIKVEEFCIKPKNALFLLGTLSENPGLELTPQPIQDEEHNTLTFGQALWSNPIHINPAQSLFAQSTLSSGTEDDDTQEERSVSERMIGQMTGQMIGGGSTFHEPADLKSPVKASALQNSTRSVPAEVIQLSSGPAPTKIADMTQQQKIVAALMKAGIANPAAWAAAGVNDAVDTGSPPSTGNTPNSAEDFDPHPPVILMKGKNNPTFLISWRSQREVARSLGWKCALMIWGGPALALLSLYALLTVTHLI